MACDLVEKRVTSITYFVSNTDPTCRDHCRTDTYQRQKDLDIDNLDTTVTHNRKGNMVNTTHTTRSEHRTLVQRVGASHLVTYS